MATAQFLASPRPFFPPSSSSPYPVSSLARRGTGIPTSARWPGAFVALAVGPTPTGDGAGAGASSGSGYGPGNGGGSQGKSDKDQGPDDGSSWGALPFPIPPWAKGIIGTLVFLLIPIYQRVTKIEEEAKVAISMVEKVSEATEKVAADMADKLPENTSSKKITLVVEEIAEKIDKDAKKIDDVINKVDAIKEKMDSMVGPFTRKGGSSEKKT